MKILKLKIKNNGVTLRTIKFKENGLTLVYGDIKNPENKNSTINSLGKSLLLKMLDYILGAKNDKKIMKKQLDGMVLLATVKQENKIYKVKRIIGEDIEKAIFVDGVPKSLSEYKSMFNIQRRYMDKQIILANKNSDISMREHPSVDDYLSFLELLSLKKLSAEVSDIYKLQDNGKELSTRKRKLTPEFDNILEDSETIEEKIHILDKNVERLKSELRLIEDKVANIDTTSLKNEAIQEYEEKNIVFKKLSQEIAQLKVEKKRLSSYLNEVNDNEITSHKLRKLFDKARIEIPDMIVKRLEEVEKFHSSVISDRETVIKNNMTKINSSLTKKKIVLEELADKLDKIGEIIANDKVYNESIQLYGKYNLDLQKMLFQQGQLSQMKDIESELAKVSKNLNEAFYKADSVVSSIKFQIKIRRLQDFVYDLVEKIYTPDIMSFFDLKIKDVHKTRRPVDLILSITGEAGEGISEVKKNIIDYLIFNFNTELEILLQDSSCYNGIDPRQVSNMLIELDEIGKNQQKQAIVAINGYQVDFNIIKDLITEEYGIELSENNKLLKMDF